MDTDLPDEDTGSEQEALDRLRHDSGSASDQNTGPVRSFLQDQAERLWAASLLEKGVMLGGVALAIAGLALVVGSLFEGSSSDGADVLLAAESFTTEEGAATNTPTATQIATQIATPQPAPTASVIASTIPAAVANRESCQGIRGTTYLSELERNWYIANCLAEVSPQSEPVASPTSDSTRPPVATPTPRPPRRPLAPVEQDAFSADDAIASGAPWISTQAEAGYAVDRASCIASNVGYAWLVSCRTYVPYCEEAVCETWVSTCVTEPDGAIFPGKLC